MRSSVVLLTAAILASAPAAARPPARLPLPALHAEPDPAGGRIVDARGREVLLRGVNVNALAEYWPYGDVPTTFPLTRDDARAIATIGWNVVRLLVSWSRVEPAPGVYDDAYLDEIGDAVRLFARDSVYTVIDFHQDAWGPTLAARPGEVCQPGTEPAFGWDGAPGWATLAGGAPRCFALARELSPAVQAAFAAFFTNAPGPGGVGVRTRYAAALARVARRFARSRSVVGYDVMNEPNALAPAQTALLDDFYAEVLAAVRTAEAAAGGFPHLVLLEPSILWSDFGIGMFPAFPHDANVVFAPHIYRGGLSGGPIPVADFERARADAAVLGGAPILVGEWGSDPRRAEDPADVYFRRHQLLQDQFRFSATLWTWRESCGDPHKAGDVRAGRVPFVWGEWDVDCATNEVHGPRQALVDQLTRAYVRAAPGRLVATSYDPAAGTFVAAGESAPRGEQVVAYYPARLHGTPALAGSGVRRLRVRALAGGGAHVLADTTGGAWSLAATPGPLSRSSRGGDRARAAR
jgi:endoglycosylceramidase